MSLRQVWTRLVFEKIATDRRVIARDIQTFTHAYYQPLMSISKLADSMGCAIQTIRESVARLVDSGWAFIHNKPGRIRGGVVVPWMPLEVERQLAALLAHRRTFVLFFGEWLMRCLLDLLVKDLSFFDNAHPQWLTTPTGKRLQIDRLYYEANVAFEFQGRQHFEKDNEFVVTADDLSRRYEYDGEKIRLCALNNVRFVEVTAFDLDYYRMREEIQESLPLMPIRENGPLFLEVTGMCRQYMSVVNRR